LSAAECRFGYRDSIFKNEYQDRVAIVAVGLRLSKQWQPVLTYAGETGLHRSLLTARATQAMAKRQKLRSQYIFYHDHALPALLS
ncbi:hypothetical protein MJI47_30055, partial [Salmonella enterica subsp. enterica serovar Kentucky]|nr:hypothetical protein [Salmonella enterica subsp. enterica serovar Kentucky]